MSIGALNIAFGWFFMVVGIVMGALMGMYAFDGPLKAPRGHEGYAALPRRLIRLAHIAFVALPMISILYGSHIDAAHLTDPLKRFGSYAMIVGMIGVPTLLIGASFYNPIKYLEVVPVSAVLAALIVIAWGYVT